MLSGRTVVGAGSVIGPDCQLVDTVVGDGAVVRQTVARDVGDRRRRDRRALRVAAAGHPASPRARTSARSWRSRTRRSARAPRCRTSPTSATPRSGPGPTSVPATSPPTTTASKAPHRSSAPTAHRLEHGAGRAGRGGRRRLHRRRVRSSPATCLPGALAKGVPASIEEGWVAKREDACERRRRAAEGRADGTGLQEEAHALRRAGQRGALEEIAECLKVPLGDVKLSTFASGELYARYGESIRGADVFIVQSHCEPINDRIMQQLLMIDAAKRGVGAAHHRGVPVLRVRAPGPQGRGPRADLGAARRRPAHGGRRRPRRHRRPPHRSDPGLLRRPGRPPHRGAAARRLPRRAARRRRRRSCRPTPAALKLASGSPTAWRTPGVESDLAFIDKRRPKGTHNVAEATDVVGNVAGGVCVLVDDMIDTAGTIVSRRQPARGPGRHRGVGGRRPTACCRVRPSTG